MKVKCVECGHGAELNGDKKTSWLCPCAATRPDCDCGTLNVVQEDIEAGLVADPEVA